MCNLYSHTSNAQAIFEFVRDVTLIAPTVGNLAPQTGIFPDYAAPIVRNTPEGRELAMVRWGLPSSQEGALRRRQPPRGQAPRQGRAGRLRDTPQDGAR